MTIKRLREVRDRAARTGIYHPQDIVEICNLCERLARELAAVKADKA
jgi:hypothetical protein